MSTEVPVVLVSRVRATAALAVLLTFPALAQQQRPATAPPQPQAQKPVTWEALPRMQLEQLFGGPLKDTVIQRWRDPQTGMVRYIYLPFTVQHTAPTATGAVQYGANGIGSISCVEPTAAAPSVAGTPPRKPAARAPAAGEPSGQQ